MKRAKIRFTELHLPLPHADANQRFVREQFLETIRASAPEVLQHLHDDVFPSLHAAEGNIYIGAPLLRPFWDNKTTFHSALDSTAELQRLRDAIVRWARRFRLDVDWAKGTALLTMMVWAEQGHPNTARDWHLPPIRIPHTSTEPRLWSFGPIEYLPFFGDTQQQFKAQATANFKKSLDQYMADVEQAFQQHAYRKPAEMREPEHFEWLVLYQITPGWSFGQIASKYHRVRKTVEEAVKKLASLIELPLRPPSKGGRPKNSRDRQMRNRVI